MTTAVVLETSLPGLPVRRGKVRDIYDLGDRLLLVSTDRLSAFDWVLPTGIPDKGRVLTQIAAFWFEQLGEPNHLITTDVDRMDLPPGADRRMLAGRSHPLPQDRGRADRVRGPRLPGRLRLEGIPAERHGLRHPPAAGLTESAGCREPIFTPVDQGGQRATTRTSPSSGWSSWWAATWPRSCGAAAWTSSARRRVRPAAGHHHRRHEIRVGPIDGRTHPHRRGAHARQLPLLAGRPVRAGPRPAVVRQAVRPRLALGQRLGQEQSAACPAGRDRGQDPGEIRRGLRAADGEGV